MTNSLAGNVFSAVLDPGVSRAPRPHDQQSDGILEPTPSIGPQISSERVARHRLRRGLSSSCQYVCHRTEPPTAREI